MFIKYQPRNTLPLPGASTHFFSHIPPPESQDETQDTPLYLFFFSIFFSKDTQVYELPRSHDMFQARSRVDAWKTGTPGALQCALPYRLHAPTSGLT